MICACGYVQPCVPLVENTCKSCGDMTDSLSGVYNLETLMQDCRKSVPLMAVFRLWRLSMQCVGHRHSLQQRAHPIWAISWAVWFAERVVHVWSRYGSSHLPSNFLVLVEASLCAMFLPWGGVHIAYQLCFDSTGCPCSVSSGMYTS